MDVFAFQFEAPIEFHDVGSQRYRYTVLWLPAELVDALPLAKHPRLRITGEINDHPFDAALSKVRGRWYILLSKTFLKAIEAKPGDTVDVRFAIADQDAVNVPDVLSEALAANEALASLWSALTPGRQRGLAYRVASAKTATTQAKRVIEVAEFLRGERPERATKTR